MKIHIISHESCPCEVCTVHIYVLGNLIVGLCYFLLSPVFLFHTAALEATHTHTLWRKQRHTYTHLHIHIHSHTQNVWRTDLAAARLPPVFFFFSLQLSEPYVPQISSVNSKCARQTDMQRCAQERVSILGQSHARARAHGDAHPSGCVCMCEHGSCKTQKSMQTRRLEKHRLP